MQTGKRRPCHYRGRRSFPFLLAKPLLFALLTTQRALLSSLARNLRNQAKPTCWRLRKVYKLASKEFERLPIFRIGFNYVVVVNVFEDNGKFAVCRINI